MRVCGYVSMCFSEHDFILFHAKGYYIIMRAKGIHRRGGGRGLYLKMMLVKKKSTYLQMYSKNSHNFVCRWLEIDTHD